MILERTVPTMDSKEKAKAAAKNANQLYHFEVLKAEGKIPADAKFVPSDGKKKGFLSKLNVYQMFKDRLRRKKGKKMKKPSIGKNAAAGVKKKSFLSRLNILKKFTGMKDAKGAAKKGAKGKLAKGKADKKKKGMLARIKAKLAKVKGKLFGKKRQRQEGQGKEEEDESHAKVEVQI